jgi:hypothetical protein
MLKVSELRLGNLIFHNGEVMPVVQIERRYKTIYSLNYIDVDERIIGDHFQPIPLTPEWLERCGFVSTLSGDDFHSEIIWDDPKSDYHYCEAGYFIDKSGDYGYYCDIGDIQYLHQLQNLYYALTGEELTIKQTC